MRTALLLLFLLALAAVPGLAGAAARRRPARGRAVRRPSTPTLAPWLDRLSLFDVYSSPWFAAIYLLLFVSLVGCVRAAQPARTLARVAGPAAARRRATSTGCRCTRPSTTDRRAGRRARATRAAALRSPAVPGRPASTARLVGAEKGYLRETGNLVFHLSLLLAARRRRARAACSATGATCCVVEGEGFTNTADAVRRRAPRGRSPTRTTCRRSRSTLDDFPARYQESGQQRGAAARRSRPRSATTASARRRNGRTTSG